MKKVPNFIILSVSVLQIMMLELYKKSQNYRVLILWPIINILLGLDRDPNGNQLLLQGIVCTISNKPF